MLTNVRVYLYTPAICTPAIHTHLSYACTHGVKWSCRTSAEVTYQNQMSNMKRTLWGAVTNSKKHQLYESRHKVLLHICPSTIPSWMQRLDSFWFQSLLHQRCQTSDAMWFHKYKCRWMCHDANTEAQASQQSSVWLHTNICDKDITTKSVCKCSHSTPLHPTSPHSRRDPSLFVVPARQKWSPRSPRPRHCLLCSQPEIQASLWYKQGKNEVPDPRTPDTACCAANQRSKQDKFKEEAFRRVACWSRTNLKKGHVEGQHVGVRWMWRWSM